MIQEIRCDTMIQLHQKSGKNYLEAGRGHPHGEETKKEPTEEFNVRDSSKRTPLWLMQN